MQDFQQSDKGEITVDNIIMNFLEYFNEVTFKYRVRFANNFSKMKIKRLFIFPAMLCNGGFVGFMISNTEFMSI